MASLRSCPPRRAGRVAIASCMAQSPGSERARGVRLWTAMQVLCLGGIPRATCARTPTGRAGHGGGKTSHALARVAWSASWPEEERLARLYAAWREGPTRRPSACVEVTRPLLPQEPRPICRVPHDGRVAYTPARACNDTGEGAGVLSGAPPSTVTTWGSEDSLLAVSSDTWAPRVPDDTCGDIEHTSHRGTGE
jgi:hypothetical protein